MRWAGRTTPPKWIPILGVCSGSDTSESMKTGIASPQDIYIRFYLVDCLGDTEKLSLAHLSINVRIMLATEN